MSRRAATRARRMGWNAQRWALNLLDSGETVAAVASITGAEPSTITALAREYRGATIDPFSDWRS